MGRRNDLAGLAALGALGMILNNKGKKDTDSTGGGAQAEGVSYTPSSEDSDSPIVDQYLGKPDMSSKATSPVRPRTAPSAQGVSTGSRRGPAIGEEAAYNKTKQGGSGGGRGPAFGEEAAYRQKQYADAQARANTPQGRAERQSQTEAQALTPVRPEEMIGGGGLGGIKAVAAMAKNMANRTGAKAAEYSQPAIGYAERKLLGSNGERALLQAPPKRLTGPTAAETSRAAEMADRESVVNPMAWMAGPKGMREDFKKGGKVKKSFSNKPAKASASSRGDGIAMRGKTRGMMR